MIYKYNTGIAKDNYLCRQKLFKKALIFFTLISDKAEVAGNISFF